MAQDKQWYYVKNNQQVGPIPQSELLDLFKPQIPLETPVWTQGMENWTPANKIEGLLPNSVSIAPPLLSNPSHSQNMPPNQTSSAQSVSGALENKDSSLTSENIKYAGFWIRFGAYLLDGLVFIFTYAIFGGIAFGIWGGDFSSLPPVWALVFLGFLGFVILVLSVLYFPIFESSKMQASLGKKLCGIKVIDTNGNRLSFGLAFGRSLMKGTLFGLTGGISCIIVGLTLRKQAFHDKVVDTLVVYSK